MILRSRHWIIATSGALLFHAGLAYAFLYAPKPTQGAKAEGVGGLEISISMVASTVGAPAQKEVLPVEEPEPKPDVATEPIVEPEPEPVIEPEPVKKVQVEPVVIPKSAPKPVITPPKKPVVKKKVQPKSKPKQVVKKVKKSKPVLKEAPAKKQLGLQSQGASAKSTLKANRSDATTRQGGGRIVGKVKPDYVTTLRRWLEKHKTYPKSAKRRRQQGVVILAFSITRDGQVPEFRIKKESGYKSLDEETVAMLKRAQPLPKFPKDMEGDILKIALPIQFSLR